MKKFTNLVWGVLAVLLTILAADAVASDGAMVNQLPSLLEGFIRETLFPLASALVLALVGILVKRLSEKTKVTWALDNQELIEKAVIGAIAYAEEKAAAYAKQKGETLPSDAKMNMALRYVLKSVPSVDEGLARAFIEAMLGRVIGAGATGPGAISVTGTTAVEVETKTITNR